MIPILHGSTMTEALDYEKSTSFCFAQVRQHTEHKRTFLYLEQLILKHGADANCVSIKNIHQVTSSDSTVR